ncbi:hypothetical protein evm_003850 [Chilo suppressalis]|nr:hypothetical protein evm_003850 [Chilo suppressalis]
MSDTDDTDVLLLIPPNFFLVNTSSSEESLLDSSRTVVHKPSCTAQVLGKLVDQVHSLESRLSNLEVNSTAESVSSFSTLPRQKRSDTTNSFDSVSVDCKYYTFPRRRRRRRTNKRERKRDLSLTSLDTPSTSTKEIPHLKLTQGFDVASFKNSDFNDNRSMDGDISSIVSTPSKKNDKLLLHEIDEFLTKVEAYESPESKFRDQMTTLSPENVIKATGDYISHKLEQSNLDDVKLPSGRIVSSNILDKYIYLVNNQPQISHPEKSHPPSISQKSNIEDTSSMSCSDIKDPPISKCDSKSPSIRKLNFSDTKDVQPTSTPKRLPPQRTSSLDSFRPSSHKIYDRATKVLEHYKSQNYSRTEPNSMINSNYLISPKKEEFKMPQMRPYRYDNKESASTASMQNKLIDSIDTDLLSLSDLWGEKGEKLERGESLKLEEERLKREKTNHFEAELYKALDLAHDYQNKCKQLTEEKKQLEEGMEKALANQREVISNKEREIEMLKENYNTVMKLNKQSTDCVKNLEDALNKEKTEHELTNSKSNDLGRKLESLNGEVSLLLQERDLLKNKVNEERSRSNILERQLCEKQNQTSDLLKKCDTLDYEVKTLRKQLEVQKNELKVHYQKQLEEAVLAKLQEFQQQLDHAEKELEHDARTKEDAIVDNFNKQIARIEEQHKLEVNVLEEKQKEEINLYRLQLAQVNEKVGLLENKLESYRRRRGQIASQLHGVMEAQWRQALLILTNGHHASSLDLTRPDSENLPATSTPVGQDYAPPKLPASIPALDRRSRPSQSHNSFNFEALSDNELQHYVKLLLSKPPGVEGGGDCAPAEEPTSDRPQRKRSINTSKPPWKA